MAGRVASDLAKDCAEGAAEHVSRFALGEIDRFGRAEAESEGMKAERQTRDSIKTMRRARPALCESWPLQTKKGSFQLSGKRWGRALHMASRS